MQCVDVLEDAQTEGNLWVQTKTTERQADNQT